VSLRLEQWLKDLVKDSLEEVFLALGMVKDYFQRGKIEKVVSRKT
jgi:hypothetical protein